MTSEVVVIKQNLAGQETWRYTGTVLQKLPNSVLIRALFNRKDLPFHGIVFAEGDVFYEQYYSDRWYNIFEIHSHQNGLLKGWYCNLTRPAVIVDDQISYVDLALDLLVYPDGRQLVLDRDEYQQLELTSEERSQVERSLQELQRLFEQKGFRLT